MTHRSTIPNHGNRSAAAYGLVANPKEAAGKLQFTRASHVEPDAEGYWFAAMGPVGGPALGP